MVETESTKNQLCGNARYRSIALHFLGRAIGLFSVSLRRVCAEGQSLWGEGCVFNLNECNEDSRRFAP